TALVAHCEAAGGATFAPMARAVRTLLRIDDGSVAEHAREGGRVNVLEKLVEAGQRGNAMRAAIGSVLPRDDDADRGRIVGGIAALPARAPRSPGETVFLVRRLLPRAPAAHPVGLAP